MRPAAPVTRKVEAMKGFQFFAAKELIADPMTTLPLYRATAGEIKNHGIILRKRL